MQTLNTKTGMGLGYDVGNQQAGTVVRRGESVNQLNYLRHCWQMTRLFRRYLSLVSSGTADSKIVGINIIVSRHAAILLTFW
jgi:hypothetical protein